MSVDLKEVSIDEEIRNLERIYSETESNIQNDYKVLINNVLNHKEPESLNILDEKIDKEREYI